MWVWCSVGPRLIHYRRYLIQCGRDTVQCGRDIIQYGRNTLTLIRAPVQHGRDVEHVRFVQGEGHGVPTVQNNSIRGVTTTWVKPCEHDHTARTSSGNRTTRRPHSLVVGEHTELRGLEGMRLVRE